jgi:hypothetical protein
MVLNACSHSSEFTVDDGRSGPVVSGPPARLTLNTDQDYWPVRTEDGTGILYAFVDSTQHDHVRYGHRCIGLIPPTGGARSWQWCDNQAVQTDSLNSFPAFALGSDGRLLYLEATAPAQFLPSLPTAVKLWLADTLHPFRRRALAALPVVVDGHTISWMADLAWTGPTEFVALGQQFVPASHCIGPPATIKCPTQDSVFFGEIVIRGSISPSGLTLRAILGTSGATAYSLARNATSVIFTRRSAHALFEAPLNGGTPTPVASIDAPDGIELLGVTCDRSVCVVALGPVTLWAPDVPGPGVGIATINAGESELRRVDLANGETVALTSRSAGLFSNPVIMSVSGDVVVQFGRMMGHLQTFSSSTSDLYLYRSLVR